VSALGDDRAAETWLGSPGRFVLQDAPWAGTRGSIARLLPARHPAQGAGRWRDVFAAAL